MGRVVAVTMAALNCLSHVVIVTCMVKDSPKRFNVDRIGSGASERKDCDYIPGNFFSRYSHHLAVEPKPNHEGTWHGKWAEWPPVHCSTTARHGPKFHLMGIFLFD